MGSIGTRVENNARCPTQDCTLVCESTADFDRQRMTGHIVDKELLAAGQDKPDRATSLPCDGRDMSFVYDPTTVHELSDQERADQLQRSQAMLGIRALARAIDAKDHSTRELLARLGRGSP